MTSVVAQENESPPPPTTTTFSSRFRLPSPLSLVRANLEDPDPSTRHLMLVTIGGSALRVLKETKILSDTNDSLVLVASRFPRDETSELYLVSQINRVKRAMQLG